MAKAPLLFYDLQRGAYWRELPVMRRYVPLDQASARLHLREAGLSKEEHDGALNQIDKALFVCQTERAVDYAGPIAGHRKGLFQTGGGLRVLVTAEPPAVFDKPTDESDPATLLDFFERLLGGAQTVRLLCWLKVAAESLRKGDFRPGQMLLLAGPSGCGKSLLQAIVTEFLGGRSAKPYRYMIGETAFNGELAAAEHLVIEDENASTDIRSRRKFGTAIKEMCVNRELSIHGKGKQAISLPTFRRMTCSVNDEPENLMICPPLDASIEDKIMLFRCSPDAAPSGEDRKCNWDRFCAEIPGLRQHVAKLRIPAKMRCSRYGVASYHHPELLEVLSDVSPEARLLGLIDEILFSQACRKDWREDWSGSAEQLERDLRSSPFAANVDRLLYFSTAAGVYLGRLKAQHPDRFAMIRTANRREWTIRPPGK